MLSTARCYTSGMVRPLMQARAQQECARPRPTARRLVLAVSRPAHFTLFQLVLELEGWSVALRDISGWLVQSPGPSSTVDLVLLEAWPLHDRALARRAQEQLRQLAAPLVLLTEGEDDLALSHELGAAIAVSPLCGLETLVAALETAVQKMPLLARGVGEECGGQGAVS